MWLLLPILSLLTRIIVGNTEIDRSNPPLLLELLEEDNREFQSQFKKSTTDEPERWKDSAEENRKLGELEQPTRNVNAWGEGDVTLRNQMKLNAKTAVKKSEHQHKNPWFYLLPILAVKRKSSSFNVWNDKRASFYNPKEAIYRPIRVPFNSWGGKRSNECLDPIASSHIKGNEVACDQQDEMLWEENVKGEAKIMKTVGKMPFRKSGREKSQTTNNVGRKFTLVFEDESDSSTENGLGSGKRYERTLRNRQRFNSWGGKRGNIESQEQLHLNNNRDHGYMAEEEDKNNKWLISFDKRPERGQLRKVSFYPWGGKRGSIAGALQLLDDNLGAHVSIAKGRRAFFPWGG